MDVFEFTDYKAATRAWIDSRPGRGRGVLRDISRRLKIHTSRLSQVFRGHLDLTLEQAHALTQYMGFASKEAEYYLLLVERERAGTQALQEFFRARAAELRAEATRLSNLVPKNKDATLSAEDRAIFYSSGIYALVSLLCDVPGLGTAEALAERLQLPRAEILRVLSFLKRTGLVVETSNGYRPGTTSTHLEDESPLVVNHHVNWRTRAIQRYPHLTREELAYSAPMVVSREDFQKIRKRLAEVIKDIVQVAVHSKSERVACLGIDFFEIK